MAEDKQEQHRRQVEANARAISEAINVAGMCIAQALGLIADKVEMAGKYITDAIDRK